jgi:tetratricopeptide (TPR) repeat protein
MRWFGLGLRRRSKAHRALSLRNLQAAGDAARDQRNWEEAARFYEEIIKTDTSTLDIVVQLGHTHKEMGNYDRAGELYFSVLTHRYTDDDLHLQIGHLEKLRGNFAKALHHYKEAANLNPQNNDAQREHQALNKQTEVARSAGAAFDQVSPRKIGAADSNLGSRDSRREEHVEVNSNAHNGDAGREYPVPPNVRTSIASSSGMIARPRWAVGRLPRTQDAGDGFVFRVREIEQFLTAPHTE